MLVGLARIGIEILKFPWGNVAAGWAGTRGVWNVDVEALLQGRVRFRPKVPLAKMPCGIAHIMQRLCQRAVFGFQTRRRIRLHHLLIRRPLLGNRRLQHNLRHVAIGHGDARARRAQSGEQG